MVWDLLVAAALVIGAGFALVGSYGLVKLDGPMSRLHAPTKAGTLGVGGVLIGSLIHGFAYGDPTVHELLITVFLFVTAPVSALFIAKVHIHTVVRREDLPIPGGDETWSILDTDEPGRD
jgi:multicomponent K+:H+ antiporter subunit G